jgi:hypothetical protein
VGRFARVAQYDGKRLLVGRLDQLLDMYKLLSISDLENYGLKNYGFEP